MSTNGRGSRLSQLARDITTVIPAVDTATQGQYGDGLGSESEERQIRLILKALVNQDEAYADVEREVSYPDRAAGCDLLLPEGIPVEVKLLRYWRANGDAEDYWYTHIFSPFNKNTLLTDAKRLHESEFDGYKGLLGLFYQRGRDDPETVNGLPERFIAEELAEKVVHDIEYWYDFDAEVCEVASFDGLQHTVHQRGAAITWTVS